MTKRVTGILSAVLLTIALVAFTGSALAGNNGNGNGNGNGGNSATAPGQAKKSTSPPSSVASPNTPGTKPGVKPSNTTNVQHNTTAPATSNKTKLYGNGKTAGQIAVQNGYTGPLFGPGNSQPHKATVCGRSIDVHALKSHAATCASGVVLPSLGGVGPVVTGGVLGALASLAASVKAHGGVLGATAQARGGVLGAVAAKQGKLPFTGFPVWVALLIGFSLTAAGLGLRLYARATI